MERRGLLARGGMIAVVATCMTVATEQDAAAQPCELPNNGGTVVLPDPNCPYLSPDEFHMVVDGLPADTEIIITGIHRDFICKKPGVPQEFCNNPGGPLGGEEEFFQSTIELNMEGTGDLAGFSRTIELQLNCHAATGPRNPGDAVQTFPNEMVQLQGQLFGDPDFCTFEMRAGAALGLPSPGQTTLTRLGPPGSDFQVDSFFDIAYQIEFQGCPGSQLEGFGGTTTGTVRMVATGLGPADCAPDATGQGCAPVDCPVAGQECLPTCVNFDPGTGAIRVLECNCLFIDECHVQIPGAPAPGPSDPCLEPDNGTGTVTLPPAGCEYLSPDEVHLILDGLPPDTTIELAPIHKEFICNKQPGGMCTIPIPPGECEAPGGDLGGQGDCFDSVMELQVNGTGDLAGYSRLLTIPLQCEVHTGPRNPGDAVQDFATKMFRIQGELFGDPDFCTLRVRGGDDFGLPSPGHTTLTRLGPPGSDFQVDSFFDIAYEIEFQGCPGSPLDGLSGTTTATIRMVASGGGDGFPPCVGGCPPGEECEQEIIQLADGTFDICCHCVPAAVEGACCFDADGDGIQESCNVVDPAQCDALGGTYQGDNTICQGFGACCFDADGDGISEACATVDGICCEALGGVFDPTVMCQGQGACCLDFDGDGVNESCIQADGACCTALGGTFEGVNTQCQGVGACCFGIAGGACLEIDGICCDNISGVFLGAGSVCLGDGNNNGIDDACEPSQDCGPDPDGFRCLPVTCPEPNEQCLPREVIFDPLTGAIQVVECDCVDIDECHVAILGDPIACPPAPAGGNSCVEPNAGGTVMLPPPGCGYVSPEDAHMIIDGLPAGTEIIVGAEHTKFNLQNSGPGGNLGGEFEQFSSGLLLEICGTGDLSNFNRFIFMQIDCETHTAPRTPGDAVQSFETDFFRLQGEIFGDPDFDVLRVRGGTDFGLPSPGHTTLTRLGPPGSNFQVDSFFDIEYQIEFQGAPGSALEGFAGTTQATIRMKTGGAPDCVGGCPPGEECDRIQEVQDDGTIRIRCECQPPPPCPWDFNGNGIVDFNDLLKLLANWGPCPDPCPWDFSGNNVVDFNDLLKLLARWGPCPQ